jgi:hypothetical protein
MTFTCIVLPFLDSPSITLWYSRSLKGTKYPEKCPSSVFVILDFKIGNNHARPGFPGLDFSSSTGEFTPESQDSAEEP